MPLLRKSFAALAVAVSSTIPAHAQKVDEFGFVIVPRPATPFDGLFTERQRERLGISVTEEGYVVAAPSNNLSRPSETVDFFCPFSFGPKAGQVITFDNPFDDLAYLRITTTEKFIEAVTIDPHTMLAQQGIFLKYHYVFGRGDAMRASARMCRVDADQPPKADFFKDCTETNFTVSPANMLAQSNYARLVCNAAHAFLPLRPEGEAAPAPVARLAR